jgi:hypothetical protein
LWRADVMRAMRALFEGRLEDGEAIAQRAYTIGTQSQQPGALQSFVIQTFFLAWQRSGLGDLLPSAAEWAQNNESAPGWRAALAVSYAEAGRTDDAANELAWLTRDDFAAVPRDNLWLATMCLCAHASWRIDDIAMAVALRSRIAPYANRNVTIGTALALGAAGRSLGQLDAMRGDLDSAVVVLDRAVAANERMGSTFWAGQARRDLVDVLQRRALPADLVRAEEELSRPGEATVAP